MAAVPYALLAALAFALGTTLQQRGALRTEAGAADPRFYAQIFTHGVWLAGGALQIFGGLLQLVALDHGPLVVVQPVLALNLVFALPLGYWLSGQEIGRRQIVGAAVVTVGLVAFVVIGQPHGGSVTPSATRWITVATIVLIGGAASVMAARGRPPAMVAGLIGGAAGIAFGFEAALAKEFTRVLGDGIPHAVANWSMYALIAAAITGSLLEQASLKAGVLPAAMASLGVLSLIVGVALGMVLFGDTLAHGTVGLIAGMSCLAVAVAGLLVLVRPPRPKSVRQVSA
jgi:drug/metabolite transporter (DMT)-like permease